MSEPIPDEQLALLRRWADAGTLPTSPRSLPGLLARLGTAEAEVAALAERLALIRQQAVVRLPTTLWSCRLCQGDHSDEDCHQPDCALAAHDGTPA